jgi:Asp/Glu/hydantoin racemase
MSTKLVFIHTVLPMAGTFDDLAREILPAEVEVYHVGDDMLAKVVVRDGGLSPFIYRRLAEHVLAAERAGADVVQVTCSSISPCVDPAATMVEVPVLKIDEAMVDAGLSLGERIGVAATAMTALKPTCDLVKERARAGGRQVEVEPAFCEGAYQAMYAQPDVHDRIIRSTLRDLATRNDVILLAQGSMARVADTLSPEDVRVPVLSNTRLAIERLRDVILNLPG